MSEFKFPGRLYFVCREMKLSINVWTVWEMLIKIDTQVNVYILTKHNVTSVKENLHYENEHFTR